MRKRMVTMLNEEIVACPGDLIVIRRLGVRMIDHQFMFSEVGAGRAISIPVGTKVLFFSCPECLQSVRPKLSERVEATVLRYGATDVESAVEFGFEISAGMMLAVPIDQLVDLTLRVLELPPGFQRSAVATITRPSPTPSEDPAFGFDS